MGFFVSPHRTPVCGIFLISKAEKPGYLSWIGQGLPSCVVMIMTKKLYAVCDMRQIDCFTGPNSRGGCGLDAGSQFLGVIECEGKHVILGSCPVLRYA